MPIYPLQRVFYPQNRPCTPKIVGTFYMEGYKVKEKTAMFQNSVGTLYIIFASQGLQFGSPFSPPLADLECILKFMRNATWWFIEVAPLR